MASTKTASFSGIHWATNVCNDVLHTSLLLTLLVLAAAVAGRWPSCAPLQEGLTWPETNYLEAKGTWNEPFRERMSFLISGSPMNLQKASLLEAANHFLSLLQRSKEPQIDESCLDLKYPPTLWKTIPKSCHASCNWDWLQDKEVKRKFR